MPYEGIYDEKFEERCEQKIQEIKNEQALKPYIIVTQFDVDYYKAAERLAEKVNVKKVEGYSCVGGISTIKEALGYRFAQAMEYSKK